MKIKMECIDCRWCSESEVDESSADASFESQVLQRARAHLHGGEGKFHKVRVELRTVLFVDTVGVSARV